MTLRLIAAIMFTAAGAMCGVHFSEKLRSERELCRSMTALIIRCSSLIRALGLDVYRLSRELRDGGFESLSFIDKLPEEYSYGVTFSQAWKNAVDTQSMGSEARGLLIRLGNILGTSDIDGQVAALSVLQEESEELSTRCGQAYITKSRLYRSAGALFGIMLGIIII